MMRGRGEGIGDWFDYEQTIPESLADKYKSHQLSSLKIKTLAQSVYFNNLEEKSRE